MRDINRVVGRNLKVLRQLRNLSQKQLADLIPIDQTYISAIERCSKTPALDTLAKIAVALSCNITDLLNDDSCFTMKESSVPEGTVKEQPIIIERTDGTTTTRYILPPTPETYEFLAKQLLLPDTFKEFGQDKRQRDDGEVKSA